MNDSMVITVPFDELEGLKSLPLATGYQHRVDVVTERAVLPFLVVPRAGADRVIVLNNGAVDHDISQGHPVFQRSRWWQDIGSHQIYFCDPGTVGTHRLTLAWGHMDNHHWVVPEAVTAIEEISRALGITHAARRSYFGSSAGGFMALAMLSRDPNAQAVINNAQFDWTRWMPPAVNALRRQRFEGMLPLDIRNRFPESSNVLNALSTTGKSFRIKYYVNLASKHDIEIDLPMFQEYLVRHPETCRDIRIHHYFDRSAGHNPMRKEKTLAILRSL